MKKKIVIVGKYRIMMDLIAAVLTAKGYEVRSIFQAEDVSTFTVNTAPDLILIDIDHPDIARLSALTRIPVVAYVSQESPEETMRASQLGFLGCVPVNIHTLPRNVEGYLSS
jgi:DNA-binding NtrC family response regulator